MIDSEAVFYKMQEQLFRKSREATMRGTHDAIVRQRGETQGTRKIRAPAGVYQKMIKQLEKEINRLEKENMHLLAKLEEKK